jgi:cell wall-associated NlpC family hydrolase
MISQLLFGECAEWLQDSGDFYQVRCRYDGYIGWVQKVQVSALPTGILDTAVVLPQAGKGWVNVNGYALELSPGSEFYYRASVKSQWVKAGLEAGPYRFQYLRQPEPIALSAAAIIAQARLYLGASYLWGGKSIWGIDCSGLVQMAYKAAGLFVPRDAWQQAEGGDVVSFIQEAAPGDLAFFDNAEGRITHVGILISNDQILHASGQVRIDSIDHHGIIHSATGQRTHQLRVIKRFF